MMDLDYIDPDVGYLLGLLVARGELLTGADYRIIIHFPKALLAAQGLSRVHPSEAEHGIQLGLQKVRERLRDITGADDQTVITSDHIDLVLILTRRTIAFRDLEMILGEGREFRSFEVPGVIINPDTPVEIKREFVKGFADVAGNIRPSNRDRIGLHRVRLDILNARGTWETPVKLCNLMQSDLGISVPGITWGHPNLGRAWREHQLNIYAEDFLPIGFHFDNKQKALVELAEVNRQRGASPRGCPGERRNWQTKQASEGESDAEHLPEALLGKHFNAYWSICRALGCPRRPLADEQLSMPPSDEQDDE